MVTAPAAANPVFRKLRRFGELLITLPSFVIFVPPSQRFVGVALVADSVILVGPFFAHYAIDSDFRQT
jgi:hypothetical protein